MGDGIYTGACPGCGSIAAAIVDRPENRDEVALEVASYIRSGLKVGRVEPDATTTVRVTIEPCVCSPNPRKEAPDA